MFPSISPLSKHVSLHFLKLVRMELKMEIPTPADRWKGIHHEDTEFMEDGVRMRTTQSPQVTAVRFTLGDCICMNERSVAETHRADQWRSRCPLRLRGESCAAVLTGSQHGKRRGFWQDDLSKHEVLHHRAKNALALPSTSINATDKKQNTYGPIRRYNLCTR